MTGADAAPAADLAYWEQYYSRSAVPDAPSAFARFVTGRLPGTAPIIEIGCGNGRDSRYFLAQGRDVSAADACDAAVGRCRDHAAEPGPGAGRAQFIVGGGDDPETWALLTSGLTEPPVIYARFLFHAVDDAAESAILRHAAAVLHARGGALCAEFRTPRDESTSKIAPAHYRRFVDPDAFVAKLGELGLTTTFRTEGFGMAVYQTEDAHVARIVATP